MCDNMITKLSETKSHPTQIAKEEAQRKRRQQAAQAAEAQKRREGGDLSKDLFAAPTRAVSTIMETFLCTFGPFLTGIPTHPLGVSLDRIYLPPNQMTQTGLFL